LHDLIQPSLLHTHWTIFVFPTTVSAAHHCDMILASSGFPTVSLNVLLQNQRYR